MLPPPRGQSSREATLSSSVQASPRRALSVVTVCVDKSSIAGLREAVHSLSGFDLSGEYSSYAAESADTPLIETLQVRRPDICVVDFDRDRQKAVLTVEQIRESLPSAAVFALSADSRPDIIIEAMRSGSSEYLLKPVVRERVVEALVKFESKRRDRTHAKKGRVFTLLGAKGGTGVTTVATHLAVYAAQAGARTLLIDQHPDLGDVSVYLSVGEHKYNFYELVNNIHRLDTELLQGFLVHHGSSLDVLTSPESFGAMVQASPAALSSTLDFLRDVYDVILMDCAPGLNGFNVTAIDRSDVLYLIGTPELPSIRNMARYIDHLKRFNCPDEKIKVVINRYSKRAAITEGQIAKAIRTPVSMLLPNCYADVIEAIHAGVVIPMSSRSELAQALSRWASQLAEAEAEGAVRKAESKRRFGILGL